MKEPDWRRGLRSVWEGLQNLEDPNKSNSPAQADAKSHAQASKRNKDEDSWRDTGRWITCVAIVLLIAAMLSWTLPITTPDNANIVGGVFLKLAIFFGGVRLAWPQLRHLLRWKLGIAGLVCLLIAAIVFAARPKAALVIWPLLMTIVGGLAFLGWLSRMMSQMGEPRPRNRRR